MEPVAPGTEDDIGFNFSISSKQDKERERILAIKAVLPNGKYGNVFEHVSGTNWYCNACACPVMGWVYHHETGKRHNIALGKLATTETPPASENEEGFAIQIAPGEPVPPGFEGQIERVTLIQDRLDSFNIGPLVALEYLLELRDYDANKEPTYLCILCDKKGDPRTVLTHLASYKHITQYLQKHFPTCYRALAPFMVKQYKRNWQTVLHEVAEAIEKKFGRLRPMPVEADKYDKNPVHYIELIAKGKHFSELSGYTFEEYINKQELVKFYEDDDKLSKNVTPSTKKKSPSPPVVANPIKKIKYSTSPAQATSTSTSTTTQRRRSLSSVSSITSSDLSDFDEKKAKKSVARKKSRSPYRRRSPFTRRYKSPKRDDKGRRDRREQERDRDLDRRSQDRDRRDRERNLLPWEKSNYTRSKTAIASEIKPKTDKLEEYKKLCKAIDNDMERILKQHIKNPEKHVQYNEEWKKFWNKRYKELQSEGKNVSTHDFKPEWIDFWNKRMLELHQEEIKIKKESLRKRLGLPEEPSPISFKILNRKKGDSSKNSPVTTKPVPIAALPDNDPEIIVIDDKDDESKGSLRSRSPWEEDTPRHDSRKDKKKVTSRDVSRDRDYKGERSFSRRISRMDRSPSPRRDDFWDSDYKKSDYNRRIRVLSDLPWERERDRKYSSELSSYYKPPNHMREATREPVLYTPPPKEEEEDEQEGDINVVAILRLLTALEDKLGSLGPKVIDLLGQALGMEKNEANSSETLLDNEVNCVLFETVKEKLKGLLHAGFVEAIQEKAFKTAIKKTASLIHAAGERKKECEKNKPKVDPVKVPGIGTVDKAAIARQIANALVLQGKTDVTQDELEQLINAVVGMAEASKNSDKPMTTAGFLEQMSKGMEEKKESKPIPVAEKIPKPKPEEKSVMNNMESLSDSDLQTLLQNFKDLSNEEQHGLINYLKKLEAGEPERVERLRKFVNLGQKADEGVKKSERESPFSNRVGSVNPSVDDTRKLDRVKLPIDSDDEEYSFEDVAKAASKNVKLKELEKEREIVQESIKFESRKDDLKESKARISNMMGSMSTSPSTSNLIGLAQNFASSADFTRTLNSLPVNIASLAHIVGSVQNMTAAQKPTFDMFSEQQFQNPKVQAPPCAYAPPQKDKQTKVTYPNFAMYTQQSETPEHRFPMRREDVKRANPQNQGFMVGKPFAGNNFHAKW